ncbi:MAG TPA: hypothetical protein VGF99_21485 [Myxococcota bacterium]
MRVPSVVSVIGATLVFGATGISSTAHADDSWQYACDGTDEALIDEIKQAFEAGVGFGETWDETICNQGVMVLGEGVRRPKPPPTPEQRAAAEAEAKAKADAAAAAAAIEAAKPKPTLLQQKMESQFFALFIPVFAFFVTAIAMVIAAVIVVFLRLRKQIVVDVECPSCRTRLPFVVGESPQLFCPACGGACRVSVEMKGKTASAFAVPL